MDARTRQIVRQRAGGRCEYCLLPEAADEWPFHVDHIIARVHGGDDVQSNLSWSCTQCNLHKASNFASIDPASGERVNLFNPREQNWIDHFAVGQDGGIIGVTAAGRATVRLLDMNGIPQIDLRRELIQQGAYRIE
ncbi:MAG: HNH endonuclease signature motif containing protein [Pirellulales bacterium]